MRLFTTQNLKLKIGLNTIYQIIGRFITAFTGLLVTKLIINQLGLTGFGNYQIAVTYVTIFWMLTDFGLNAVVVREMAADPQQENKLFGSLVTLRTGLSLILAIISSLILIFLPYSDEIKIAIIIGTVTFFTQGIRGATHGLFQTRLRYELQLLASLLGAVIFLGATFFVLSENPSVIPLVIAFTLGQIIAAIISVYLANHLSKFYFCLDLNLLKKLAIATIPFGISLLFNLGNFKIDAFLLSILKIPNQTNAEVVGIYNVAYKFFEFALIIPTFLMNAIYPIMIRVFEKDFSKFKKLFWQSFATLFSIALLGTILAFILSPFVISLVANLDEFYASVAVLRILMIAAPIFFLSSLLMWTVLTFKDQRVLVRIYALAFLTNLCLNLWLIPKYSFYAAAITTGVSELLILLLLAGQIYSRWREFDE